MSAHSANDVTIVVCTRDRAEACAIAVRSILVSARGSAELVIVDQSEDDRTRLMLVPLERAGLRYVRSQGRGLSAARNIAAGLATGGLMIFTDDDCVVDEDWVAAWREAFADPAVGIGFGRVKSPAVDMTSGYIADFHLRPGSYGEELFLRGAGHVGMGANMALRRDLWATLGGFDEGLGAGTRVPSGEDLDMAYRVMRAGHRVCHTEAAWVVHHGYRSGSSASRLVRGYVAGIAATYVKHARCGDVFAARLLAREVRWATVDVARHLGRRRRPLGLRSLAAYVTSAGAAVTRELDSEHRLYRPEGSVRA